MAGPPFFWFGAIVFQRFIYVNKYFILILKRNIYCHFEGFHKYIEKKAL